MTLASGNIRYMRIFPQVPRGVDADQMTIGLSTTAIFGDLDGYFFGNFREKARNTWRYATPCRPMADCKMNDLE